MRVIHAINSDQGSESETKQWWPSRTRPCNQEDDCVVTFVSLCLQLNIKADTMSIWITAVEVHALYVFMYWCVPSVCATTG